MRRRMTTLSIWALIASVSWSVALARAQGILYVDANATGNVRDGSSWCSAYWDLQDALEVASPGTIVRVADATYTPNPLDLSDPREATFLLPEGITLEGGYAGCNAPDPDERNISFYRSILSGDLGGNDGPGFVNYDENAFHVVTANANDTATVVDGFTVTGGFSADATWPHGNGGGINLAFSAAIVKNCTFLANKANVAGGGVYMIGMLGSEPSTFINCVFSGNLALNGAGVFSNGADVQLVNCTLSANTATGNGGGLYLVNIDRPRIDNCIFWGNVDAEGTSESSQLRVDAGAGSVNHSCIQGWSGRLGGACNIGDDVAAHNPRFSDADGPDGVPGTADDNVRLSGGSPCIDVGLNAAVPSGTAVDPDGTLRFLDDPATADCGVCPEGPVTCGTSPIVDMGAFEHRPSCNNDSDCGDGVFCNGEERCVLGECVPGEPPECADGVACTDDRCDGNTDACVHVPENGLCDNGLYCDGGEICNPVEGCQPGNAPCTDPSQPHCEEPDRCLECLLDEHCDDGDPCNGLELCTVEGTCQGSGITDCNTNGVDDACDIEAGFSDDCDTDGIPDECQLSGTSEAQRLLNINPEEGENFGQSVGVSGNWAIVSAGLDNDAGHFAGSLVVFERVPGAWSPKQKVFSPDPQETSFFGSAVAIEGDVIAAKELRDPKEGGVVHVYRRGGVEWEHETTLRPPDGQADPAFGGALSLSGAVLMVGSPEQEIDSLKAGAVFVYRYAPGPPGSWIAEQTLTAPDTRDEDRFGQSVSVQGNLVAIGSARDTVFLFRYYGNSWVEDVQLTASDAAPPADNFGASVSLHHNQLIIGASLAHGVEGYVGAAYVFGFDGVNWIEEAKLLAPDGAYGDGLGSSVAILGDLALASAPWHDSEFAENNGAVYLFRLVDAAWAYEQKLTPMSDLVSTQLGGEIALDGPNLLVSAMKDRIDGLQIGAAYSYTVLDDCNENDRPDECDLSSGFSVDCNDNGLPDECEIDRDSSAPGGPFYCRVGCDLDANGNGVPDECDPVDPILYVDLEAVGGMNTGSSWADAYTDLQTALARATASLGVVREIWVAKGTYTPVICGAPVCSYTASSPERLESFWLINGVGVYGGFEGVTPAPVDLPDGEAQRDQRNSDPETNGTILSGDLNDNDFGVSRRDENSYHVVVADETDSSAILDGFRIRRGNADGEAGERSGGGMVSINGHATLANCIFEDNQAAVSGGGLNAISSNLTFSNCLFRRNSARYGGALHNTNDSSPTLTNCSFLDNNGELAGAMYNEGGSSPTLIRCLFERNTADGQGGAIWNRHTSSPTFVDCQFIHNTNGSYGGAVHNQLQCHPSFTNVLFMGNRSGRGGAISNADNSRPTFVNCVFNQNVANWDGGAMYDVNSTPTLTNCTLVENEAVELGGGLRARLGNPTLTNCILWGNRDSTGSSEAAQINTGSGTPAINHCCIQGIQGNLGGVGNIGDDPLFVDADGPDNQPGNEDDNLRLAAGSPCLDSGLNDADTDANVADLQPLPEFDHDRGIRFVDIADAPDCPQPKAECGLPPIVDMGAYESSPRLFVDCEAVYGANLGLGWANAFTDLQSALDKAASSAGRFSEIWVADCTYVPSKLTDQIEPLDPRSATFKIMSGVAIYGGFQGATAADGERQSGEIALSERNPDPDTNGTVLSGVIDAINDREHNAYHVVTTSGTDATAVLDGFTIRDGIACGTTTPWSDDRYQGGGILNVSGSPTIRNCTISHNLVCRAWGYGAGMHNRRFSNPTLVNCTFFQNGDRGTFFGGGMANKDDCQPVLIDCTFRENMAVAGGGMYNRDGSHPRLTRCRFEKNTLYITEGRQTGAGGGMSNLFNCSPQLVDCWFVQNVGSVAGGALSLACNCNATLTNCFFIGNTLGPDGFSRGGAVRSYASSPEFVNCLFTGNTVTHLHTAEGGAFYFEDDTDFSSCGIDVGPTNPLLQNCTLSANAGLAPEQNYGGGIYCKGAEPTANPTLRNCILWGNEAFSDTTEMAQIYRTEGAAPLVEYSLVEGWTGSLGGIGNIGGDPLAHDPRFVSAFGLDDVPGTEDDDLRLRAGSPGIDAGDPGFVPGVGDTDLDGRPRLFCSRVDMGAYEFGLGDVDGNDVVDLSDFVAWVACMTGPDNGPYDNGCDVFESNGDGDIDLEDFAGFQGVSCRP